MDKAEKIEFYTRRFVELSRSVQDSLRKNLDELGLKSVQIKILEPKIDRNSPTAIRPVWWGGVIQVAIHFDPASPGGARNLDSLDALTWREVIFAFREKGVFTSPEWKILAQEARRRWRREYRVESAPGRDESDRDLEAVARAFADWMRRRRQVTPGVSGIFQKGRNVISALGRSLKEHDISSPDQIFESIAAGEMGRRLLEAEADKFTKKSSASATSDVRQALESGALSVAQRQSIEKESGVPSRETVARQEEEESRRRRAMINRLHKKLVDDAPAPAAPGQS